MNTVISGLKCFYCNSEDTVAYFVADMPNILSACPHYMLKKVKIFPFEARLCTNCLLGFNATVLDDREIKLIYDNYLYISPLRGIGSSKYNGMIGTLKKYYEMKDDIVEVGCSEGYLLNEMRKSGFDRLTGIEPGPQAGEARRLGLNVIRDYFDENTFNGELKDGFVLMHVFEHFKNPFRILEAMKSCLSPSGKIVIEVPDFDGYNHQHLFFYNLSFLKRLCGEKGLKIVESVMTQGSLRVVAVHDSNKGFEEIGYSEYQDAIIEVAVKKHDRFKKSTSMLNHLLGEKTQGKIYWWGAGTSSVIFLNQINKDLLNKMDLTIVDGDEKKWGMYIPGLNIEVQPFSILSNKSLDTLIIASQLYKEIQMTCERNNICVTNVEVLYE